MKLDVLKKYCLFLMISLAISMHYACNKESACLQYANISAKIDFKHENDTLLVTDTILKQPLLVTDSFYITQKATKTIQFLMNSTSDQVQFLITTDSNIAAFDTVDLTYNRIPHFVSKECGYNYFYTLLSVNHTKKYIKKIKIIQPLINDNINAKHLQIYY
jgi:Family of unknown function (DUF6452)